MKYKRYLHNCLINLLLLGILFSHLAKADTFLVSFERANGHGVYPDIIQINNIKVDLLDPFDPEHILDTLNYNLYFKVCNIVDGNRVTLQPNLTGEDISCSPNGSLNFKDSFITSTGVHAVTMKGVHTPDGECEINFRFDKDTLFFEQLSQCRCSADHCSKVHTISISLRWQEPPRDLDAHLTGPQQCFGDDCGENDRFHIYFGNRSNEVASLNAAEFSSGQPESIDIYPAHGEKMLRAGLYRFTAHHFVGREGNISTSNAKVSLWVCDWDSNCQERAYFEPTVDSDNILRGEGDTWTVVEFKIDHDGNLEDIRVPVPDYRAGIHPDDVR